MNYEKEYKDALERARNLMAMYPQDAPGYKEVFPELRESEDERIRKALVWHLKADVDFVSNGVTKAECIAYLEKQKEQEPLETCDADCKNCPCFNAGVAFQKDKEKEGEEELVYRLNGLMQDYIKEGKNDEEKEHRFKCYHLFWDALEDTSYFEQKEQKPVDYDAELKKCKDNPLYFYDKYVKIKLKPSEWSEEDEKHLNNILDAIDYWETTSGQGILLDTDINWLKSLRPQYHGDVTMTEAYKMGLEAGKASSWKPSEEQLNALNFAITYFMHETNYKNPTELRDLYDDLLKLK